MQQNRLYQLSIQPFWMFVQLVALVVFIQPALAQDSSGYHVIRSFHIGGKGGWDYIAVRPDAKRIYVSHDSLVNVLDEATGDSIGIVPNTPGVHGIAFSEALGKGYISAGRADMVTVFDLKTNATLKEVKTGQNPDAIMYEPFSKTIITCNGRSHDATIIDAASDSVVATIDLGGKPEAPVSDAAGNVYINIEDKNEVVHLSVPAFKVEHRWTIGHGDSPSGIAMDRDTKRLFVGCDSLMIVLSATDGKVLAELPIGKRCDGVAFDAGLKNAISSNGEGTLTVVHEESAESFRVAATVPTKRGARTIALDQLTHHIFLPTATFEPPPAPTKENPRPRPRIVPGSFEVLDVGM